MGATDFTQLKVWQKARTLTLQVYDLTGTLPQHELFGLSSQMRRAALSIGANIAEGFARRGWDQARFYEVALSSGRELRHYFIVGKDLKYFADITAIQALLDEVSAMLYRLRQCVLSAAPPR